MSRHRLIGLWGRWVSERWPLINEIIQDRVTVISEYGEYHRFLLARCLTVLGSSRQLVPRHEWHYPQLLPPFGSGG